MYAFVVIILLVILLIVLTCPEKFQSNKPKVGYIASPSQRKGLPGWDQSLLIRNVVSYPPGFTTMAQPTTA